MNRLMKTGILINRRSFSSLNVNQQSRFVLSHRSENIPRQCCHCRSISTFESIYLKLISLPAVHYVEDSLAYIHDTTGLPWSGSIMVSTVLLRLVLTLPAHVTQQKVMAKRFIMAEEMKREILPAIQKMTDRHIIVNKWSKEKAKKASRRVANQVQGQKVVEYNCHFLKLFLPMYIQIPFWIITSVGIRNMSSMRHSLERMEVSPVEERFIQMSAEGLWWCPNLSVPDPTFLLPVMVGLTFASTIFVSSVKAQATVEQSEKLQRYSRVITGVLYGLAGLMVPISCYVPSAVVLYWATSGAMGVIINLLLLHPPVRRAVRIPKIPMELEQPYKHLKEKLLRKKFL